MANLNDTEVHSRTITAFFDTRPAADKAVSDLTAEGIPSRHITLTDGGSGTGSTTAVDSGAEKGFMESLKDLFLPEDDQHTYAEGLRRGGYLLAVRADEANYTRVLDILDMDGAVDLDQREASWKSEGWAGTTSAPVATSATTATSATSQFATTPSVTRESSASLASTSAAAPLATSAPVATKASTQTLEAGRDETIQVYEEQLRVGKRDVSHGRVRLRSYVVETPVSEQVSLRDESVQIERHPVDRAVSATDVAFQDRVIEAEEHAEEAVIAKEARVKEEITLRKTAEERTQTVSDFVRHTEVKVEDERGLGVAGGPARVAGAVDTTAIIEHMDVIASDGAKIGTVDHLDGTNLKLAKNTSADGQHHYVPLAWVDHVDAHVHLNKSSAEAKMNW